MRKNHQITWVEEMYQPSRTVLHDKLALTGAEVSINTLPAGASLPFIHAHQRNEEVYLVLKGQGLFFVDGEEFAVKEGSAVRVAPAGARSLRAGDSGSLTYVCIQTQEGSLAQFTERDGIPAEGQPSWQR